MKTTTSKRKVRTDKSELRKKIVIVVLKLIEDYYIPEGESMDKAVDNLLDIFTQEKQRLVKKIEGTKGTWTHCHHPFTSFHGNCRACLRDDILNDVIELLKEEE